MPHSKFCKFPSIWFPIPPYPNPFDPSGSSVVDLQFWGSGFHCRDSGINGLFSFCGPSAHRAGGWHLQDPSRRALEVKYHF